MHRPENNNGGQDTERRICGNCAFYRLNPSKLDQFLCTKKSPTVQAVMTGPKNMVFVTLWPTVDNQNLSCGEHMRPEEYEMSNMITTEARNLGEKPLEIRR